MNNILRNIQRTRLFHPIPKYNENLKLVSTGNKHKKKLKNIKKLLKLTSKSLLIIKKYYNLDQIKTSKISARTNYRNLWEYLEYINELEIKKSNLEKIQKNLKKNI